MNIGQPRPNAIHDLAIKCKSTAIPHQAHSLKIIIHNKIVTILCKNPHVVYNIISFSRSIGAFNKKSPNKLRYTVFNSCIYFEFAVNVHCEILSVAVVDHLLTKSSYKWVSESRTLKHNFMQICLSFISSTQSLINEGNINYNKNQAQYLPDYDDDLKTELEVVNELPPGWIEVKVGGGVYFKNLITKKTQTWRPALLIQKKKKEIKQNYKNYNASAPPEVEGIKQNDNAPKHTYQ